MISLIMPAMFHDGNSPKFKVALLCCSMPKLVHHHVRNGKKFGALLETDVSRACANR